MTFIQSCNSIQRSTKASFQKNKEKTQEKIYLKGCKTNHSGFGISMYTSKKIAEQMEIAALIISLVCNGSMKR